MRESIYTIPVNDVFRENCGCPVCRLRDTLESRCTEYIMGAAMMEPDVRIETNKYGFCGKHLHMLMGMKNRLSLALMLETRMDELLRGLSSPTVGNKKAAVPGVCSPSGECFVCREVDSASEKLLSTVLRQYFADPEFKALFLAQEFFCEKHTRLLCLLAGRELPRKAAAEFTAALAAKTKQYFAALRGDVHDFVTMFDYRNTAAARDDEKIKTALERAVRFLE